MSRLHTAHRAPRSASPLSYALPAAEWPEAPTDSLPSAPEGTPLESPALGSEAPPPGPSDWPEALPLIWTVDAAPASLMLAQEVSRDAVTIDGLAQAPTPVNTASEKEASMLSSTPAASALSPALGSAALMASVGIGLALAVVRAPTRPAPPRFIGGDSTTLQTPENTAASEVVYVARTDAASLPLTYTLVGDRDDTRLNLDPRTGELRWKVSPDFEHPSSANGSNTYVATIQVQDSLGQTARQQLTLQVTDLDDAPPQFDHGAVWHLEVPENTPGPFYTAQASDNVAVTGYALSGGADQALFSLDPRTGDLRFQSPPDFEHPASAAGSNSYSVQIAAMDAAGQRALQNLSIDVIDVDDTPPSLQSAHTDASGQHILLTFSEALQSNLKDWTSLLNLQLGELARVIDQAQISGNTVQLTLASALTYGQSPMLSYAPTPSGGGLRDAAGNAVLALSRYPVRNEVPAPAEDPAPAITPAPADTTPPVFGSSANADVMENTPANQVVLDIDASDNAGPRDVGVNYSLSGADAAAFNVDAHTGELRFVSPPDYEAPADMWHTNLYHLSVIATDPAGNRAQQDLTVRVSNEAAPRSGDSGPGSAFALWQNAEDAGLALSSLVSAPLDPMAYQRHSAEIAQERDNTSRDGHANSSQVLTQWVDTVQGSDIVSETAYAAGLRLSGQAAADAEASIIFRLDKDRTDGIEGQGAQTLQLGNNDVDHDGSNDVTASYDNATGAWSLVFSPSSHALQPVTHNVYGSGVHQLVVDTDGNGRINDGEASRLFLVADGTASDSDSGRVSQNYSAQDTVTGDVFIYYYGDPDGPGIGFWSPLDNGDTPGNTGLNGLDKDGDGSDWDYYTSPTALAALAAASASNTALHLVTDIAPQIWAFHMANVGSGTWDVANALVQDHARMGSNTSRLPSLQEWLALYAANFGGDDRAQGAHTVGAIEPMSDAIQNDASAVPNWRSDNRPAGWDDYANEWGGYYWAAAPTPRGHAQMWLGYAQLGDSTNPSYAAAVL